MLEQKKNKKILSTSELIKEIQNFKGMDSTNNMKDEIRPVNKFNEINKEETYWEKISRKNFRFK